MPADFVVSKVTPDIHTALGYKMFFMFAAINIGGMAVFSLYEFLIPFILLQGLTMSRIIPETKGRSLEEMDVIFGSITQEERQAGIDKRERGTSIASQTQERTNVITHRIQPLLISSLLKRESGG